MEIRVRWGIQGGLGRTELIKLVDSLLTCSPGHTCASSQGFIACCTVPAEQCLIETDCSDAFFTVNADRVQVWYSWI